MASRISTLLLLGLAIEAAGLVTPLGRSSPMLCPLQGGLSLHALPTPFACKETDKRADIQIEVLKRNLRLWDTEATVVFKERWRCSMTCYFFGSQSKNEETTERISLTEGEARRINSGNCQTGRVDGTLVDDEFQEVKDCGCTWTGTTEHEAIRCKKQRGFVQMTHGGHMFTGLGPAAHCNYTSGMCELPDKQWLFWEPLPEVSLEYISAWKGKGHLLNNHTVVLETLQEVYSLTDCHTTENMTACNTTAGMVVKYQATPPRGDYSRLLSAVDRQSSRLKRDLQHILGYSAAGDGGTPWDWNTRVAKMLSSLRSEIMSKVAFMAAEIAPTLARVTPTCQLAVLHEKQLRILATNNPTLYVRALYDNPFLFGALSGDFIGVWPCLPVLDYEFPEQGPFNCTKDPPIKYRNERETPWILGHLDLSTNIIKSYSPTVDCKVLPVQLTTRNNRLFLYKRGEMQEVETKEIKELPFIKMGDPDEFLIVWNDTWVYNSTDYAMPDLEGEVYRYLEDKIYKDSYSYQGDKGQVINQKQGQSLSLPDFSLPFPFSLFGWLNTLVHYSGIIALSWLILRAARARHAQRPEETGNTAFREIYIEHKERGKNRTGRATETRTENARDREEKGEKEQRSRAEEKKREATRNRPKHQEREKEAIEMRTLA
uniref:Glycoprotein n=1 Tax=Nyavirus nyamaniniense TaxID=644610 RepID=A0A9E8IIL7_9MONO|nr:putative glycoprotein [Nyavirus nyamaniniense]